MEEEIQWAQPAKVPDAVLEEIWPFYGMPPKNPNNTYMEQQPTPGVEVLCSELVVRIQVRGRL